VCFVRPQFRFDARAPEVAKVRERHWFWAAIMENRRLYRDALIAALLINIFAMAMPLFTMNVYDRVVPNNAVETLWVLAIGITLVVVFNMILSTARSHVVDSASKRVDVRLSAQIMERVLDLRMEGRPVSVGPLRRTCVHSNPSATSSRQPPSPRWSICPSSCCSWPPWPGSRRG